jgi:DNA-binding XRE family transcriptional regulator
MRSRVRELREGLGLSQSELAAASGISRQLVGAVETGRHAPGVAAALALARALATTVESLFGDGHDALPLPEAPPSVGSPVRVVRVGDTATATPLAEHGAGADRWEAADGVWGDGGVELFAGAETSGLAVAGCDPALGLAAELLPARGPRRLVAIPSSSGVAARAMEAGRIHGALVHGRTGRLRRSRVPAQRTLLARWEVGLAAPPGTAIDLDAIAEGRLRVARRDPQAEAQKALERALGARPVSLAGPVTTGHLDAARRAAYGAVDVAVTMRSAAIAYGLEFVPLEEHIVELRIARDHADHPGAGALADLLNSGEFRQRLAALGGYDLSVTGAAASS